MTNLFTRLKVLLKRQPIQELSQAQEEELSNTFRARYHNFKLLLAANNKALELMAEMEAALAGDRIFGMSFVRARCTSLGVNVYSIVKNLDSLAPGRYQGLFDRLKSIQSEIEQDLRLAAPTADGELVLPLDSVDKFMEDQVGGKMANLGEIANRLRMTTPPGFAITAAAYHRFFQHNGLQEEINRRIQATVLGRTDQLFGLSSDLRQLVIKAQVPADLEEAVNEAYKRLQGQAGQGITVSMRSSAVGEDAAHSSFAGQYASQLNVHAQHILLAYKEVVASKYSPQAMHYRYVRGLRDEDLPMCVGCLAMVDARAGGVAYSSNPLDSRDQRVRITSTWGLPKGVVDGDAPADVFVVSRGDPLRVEEQVIAHKDTRFECFPDEGVCRMVSSGQEADQASLSPDQALAIAGRALELEQHYGSAQDVEWAVDQDGQVVILQCRPLMRAARQEQAPHGDDAGAEVLASGGVTASPGAACGQVFWVNKDSDALGFPPGAVLAVEQTWPRWAALLGAASAVVSQRGSLAGHLATVAREYGVPALFGLGQAASVLTNGETVTVDADGLAVYRGRVESLLERGAPQKNLMQGSPVYLSLQQVLQHIAPLNLLNPEAEEFRPDGCRTLHDITRFCHEMSVREMFSFGKEHRFPKRSSKQLYYHVPMQYWIINLDDGFDEEVTGKYVKLENIASIPMLAVWRGIVAIPWEGPPAISGRGLASVMFEATANPELSSPLKTRYADRNYFMISKNFMNLQSRFGFHFCTVEALVGERAQENYLSFSFAGGAADQGRRTARVKFIAQLLEGAGFRVELRQDTMTARQEGLEQEGMEGLLMVIGYMLMHTRQLDMIMANTQSVAYYRQKMSNDVKRLLAGEIEAGA